MQTRPHPITVAPMSPLGYTKRGKAIWPVAGGAPDEGENTGGTGTGGETPPAGSTSTGSSTPPAEQPTLTQSQVNALLAEERRKATERASGKFSDYDEVKRKAGEFDRLQNENETTLERERTKAKQEGASEVLAKANARLVAAEVRAQAAAAKFRDPHDALAHLTVSGALTAIKVSDDGDVDGEAVRTALETLAKDKAYLLTDTTTPPPPPPPTPGQAGVGAGSAGGKREVTPGVGRMRDAYASSGRT